MKNFIMYLFGIFETFRENFITLEIYSKLFSTINFNIDKFYALYSEIHTNGYFIFWLNIISLISILSGIFVIITRNPIVAVLFLIALFLEISGYLLLIGMSFIGLSYILVYISAVTMLFLFTLMLINIRISELQTDNYNSVILGFIVAFVFYLPLQKILPMSNLNLNISETISFILASFNWDGFMFSLTDISVVGNQLYTTESILLLIVSVVLLLVMTGVILITLDTSKNNTSPVNLPTNNVNQLANKNIKTP